MHRLALGSLFALPLAAVASCSLPGFDLDGRPCPCAVGYRCDEASQTCVLGTGGGSSSGGGQGQGGAGASGPTLSFVDAAFEGEFGEGTFSGTEWDGDRLRLGASLDQGSFVSRVFDAGAEVSWATIAWTPGGPYGKPLPANRGSEQGYLADNVGMGDNVLLVGFDGPPGLLRLGAQLSDASGRGNHAFVQGDVAPSLGEGVIGRALVDDTESWVGVPVGASSDLQFGVSDFSWSMWVRTTHPCPTPNPPSGNRVYLGVEETASNRTHMWFGCSSTLSTCADNDGTGRAGGTFSSYDGPSEGGGYCGKTVINDGEWHHMLVVKAGHSDATLTLYVDGEPDQSAGPTSVSFVAPFDFEAQVDLGIGAFSRGTYQAAGAFDEVAIWRRALGPDEARAVYRRAARNLRFEVRVCASADCADAPPFVSTDAEGAPLEDPATSLSPGTPLTLGALPRGRYFQYRADFGRLGTAPAGDLGPTLHEVRIGATP